MRVAGRVIWRGIAAGLRSDIESGELCAGARLPPEPALAARFGVNRHTVCQAIGSLARSGLLEVRHGDGTFVARPKRLDYHLERRTRFGEIVAEGQMLASSVPLSSQRRTATAEECAALRRPEGTWIEVLHFQRSADGSPVTLVTSRFPAERFAGISHVFARTRSVTASLRHFGVEDYTRRTTRISARLPSEAEARLLEQTPDDPVLTIDAVNVDLDGEPVEYGTACVAANRMHVVIENQPDRSAPASGPKRGEHADKRRGAGAAAGTGPADRPKDRARRGASRPRREDLP